MGGASTQMNLACRLCLTSSCPSPHLTSPCVQAQLAEDAASATWLLGLLRTSASAADAIGGAAGGDGTRLRAAVRRLATMAEAAAAAEAARAEAAVVRAAEAAAVGAAVGTAAQA